MKKVDLFVLTCIFMIISIFVPSLTLNAQTALTPEELEQVTIAGTYPIRIWAKNEQTGQVEEVIVYITVTTPTTILNEANGEGIDASSNIEICQNLQNMTAQELIRLTGAHAWQLKDGADLNFEKVTWYETEDGMIACTFETAKGTFMVTKIMCFGDETVHNTGTELLNFSEKTFLILVTGLFTFLPIPFFLFVYFRTIKQVEDMEKTLYQREEQ